MHNWRLKVVFYGKTCEAVRAGINFCSYGRSSKQTKTCFRYNLVMVNDCGKFGELCFQCY